MLQYPLAPLRNTCAALSSVLEVFLRRPASPAPAPFSLRIQPDFHIESIEESKDSRSQHTTQRGKGDRKRPQPGPLRPGAGQLNIDLYGGVSNTNLSLEMDLRKTLHL
jgi:hypothetical protein